jgi:hypothetical protein
LTVQNTNTPIPGRETRKPYALTSFEHECKATISTLRAALIALFHDVGLDPNAPQEAARRLSINKTLTWNLARLVQSSDALAAVAHVPGSASMEKVLLASEQHGASSNAVAEVRRAVTSFEQMMESHAGDRPTLDLIIDGLAPQDVDSLDLSRKLAFRGNSGLYGVQAKARIDTKILAPNPDDPTRLDIVMCSGYVGFRRLRSSVRWPLFTVRQWSDRDEPIALPRWRPLDPRPTIDDGLDSTVLRPFLKGPVPKINAVTGPSGLSYILGDGEVGNTAAFDCFRAEMMRSAASRYRDQVDETGEIGANVTAPCETLIFDLVAHRDLAFILDPEVIIFSSIFDHSGAASTEAETSVLPIRIEPQELPGTPPQFGTPFFNRYQELVAHITSRMNWDRADFRALRFTMQFPPLGSTVLARFRLPERP